MNWCGCGKPVNGSGSKCFDCKQEVRNRIARKRLAGAKVPEEPEPNGKRKVPVYGDKRCVDCRGTFTPNGARQVRCVECGEKYRKKTNGSKARRIKRKGPAATPEIHEHVIGHFVSSAPQPEKNAQAKHAEASGNSPESALSPEESPGSPVFPPVLEVEGRGFLATAKRLFELCGGEELSMTSLGIDIMIRKSPC